MKNNPREKTILGVERKTLAFSEGLRSYMLSVYNYMALGLGLTGGVALFVASSPTLFNALAPFMLIFMLAPIALVFFLSLRIQTMSFATAQMVFWIYAALNGVAFSTLFKVWHLGSIAQVFFIAAGMFLATSLYGYTTRRDLTAMGSFLFMGLIGLIIASVVNIFFANSMFQFLISLVGVGLFTGLTAYDTQAIKNSYMVNDAPDVAGKRAIFGALQLYLDFINLFLMLLNILGDRR